MVAQNAFTERRKENSVRRPGVRPGRALDRARTIVSELLRVPSGLLKVRKIAYTDSRLFWEKEEKVSKKEFFFIKAVPISYITENTALNSLRGLVQSR